MSWVLSLGAGKDQIPLIKAIHKEGHKVAAVDIRRDAEGVDLCDAFRQVSNRDIEGVVAFGNWVGVSAIMCAGSEVPDVQAHAARRLGLPCFPVLTGIAVKDKYFYKRALRESGVPVTEPSIVYDGGAHSMFDAMKYEVVIKPRRGSGSRGVSYVNSPMGLQIAIQAAEELDSDALMERYQPGPQISSETLIWDGLGVTAAFVDRLYPVGRPVFREIGGMCPSAWEDFLPASHAIICEAAHVLGIQRGTVKCDLVLTTKGPKIIEITPRLSGGPLAGLVHDATGVDYLRQAVRIALGEQPDWAMLKPTRNDKIARGMNCKNMERDVAGSYLVSKLGEPR